MSNLRSPALESKAPSFSSEAAVLRDSQVHIPGSDFFGRQMMHLTCKMLRLAGNLFALSIYIAAPGPSRLPGPLL